MTDIDHMKHMAMIARPGSPLKQVLDEVVAVLPRVAQWTHVKTSGSAACRYNPATGSPQAYEVRYQHGNTGNLVHELMHVAVNDAYQQDFVNYPNRTATPPARTYDAVGRCTNEFDRQTAYMTPGDNMRVSATLDTLINWANAATELSVQQRTDIVSKLSYGRINPHIEYDTVITQVLVWLHEWGYPIAGASPAKKPLVNALYEEVEKAVGEAFRLRRMG